ncbi:MAG: hypothetical protein WBQ94_06505 [Terracidiphilus sp.]
MNMKIHLPIALAGIGAMVVLAAYAAFASWRGLDFSIDPTQLISKMSPLLLASAFIERAVEVLVSPWRDTEASKRQVALDQAKAAPVPDPVVIKAASDSLDEYRGQTQHYALLVSLLLGSVAAMSGVRALWPLLSSTQVTPAGTLAAVNWQQQFVFHVVDVVLSAAMLAGGADGIHSMTSALTSYLDATGEQARKKAAS